MRRDALSERPQAVGRACADVLSRRSGKIAGPSAQRGQDRRAIPVGACRRQRAPIFNRVHFPGRRGGGQSLRKGYGRTRSRPSGEGFPLQPKTRRSSKICTQEMWLEVTLRALAQPAPDVTLPDLQAIPPCRLAYQRKYVRRFLWPMAPPLQSRSNTGDFRYQPVGHSVRNL